MPAVHFASIESAETIEVDFVTLAGVSQRRRLLVDSGFTGQSSFVLGANENELIRAAMDPASVSGALHGEQNRAWVHCQIAQLGFQKTLIAILAELAPLSLPDGVQGLAGLNFLRQFTRWGAEQTAQGWSFFLAFGND